MTIQLWKFVKNNKSKCTRRRIWPEKAPSYIFYIEEHKVQNTKWAFDNYMWDEENIIIQLNILNFMDQNSKECIFE